MSRWSFPLSTRYFAISAVLLVAASAGAGYAYWEGGHLQVTVLSIDDAPEGIVFIADPHLKPGNIGNVRKVIQRINELNPSIVLIGGDFLFGEEEDLSSQEIWSEIDAPVYAVLGNHDYHAGIDATSAIAKSIAVSRTDRDPRTYDMSSLFDETTNLASAAALEEVLEAHGVVVLRNEYVILDLSGIPLLLIGVDDGWAGMADPPAVPATDAFSIYMIHEPECRADWDADLILSGHTHGGQFGGTALQFINDAGILELSGYVRDNHIPVFITRGVGTSNLPWDLRIGATPEIVIINPASPVQ